MYRTKEDTQKRKDEKKQMILDTAAKVFSQKGYHNTTIKDIVNEASISVGSFYFYFKSKEDLFTELYWSIVKEFDDVTNSVLNVEHFTMLKNFTRVMIAALWMYERKREITRIILLEAAAADPAFAKLEADRMSACARTMAEWFTRFRQHDGVYIPDEMVAALTYAGTFNCLIINWLSSDAKESLTSKGYAFCVYNIQALRIPFEEQAVKSYIDEVLSELEKRYK
ncbi:MAG: TetR/AcrR family transcriptional regulator [Oscillospiraceae bacterium]|nr:TetR/AcrR family transcriptional regulator [Oscillospiraceae bacterium]